jgi:hypothetical protein
MKMTRWIVTPVVVLAVACSAWAQRGKVDLRPKFEKGAETKYVMQIEALGSTSAGSGNEQKQIIKVELGLRLRTVDVQPEEGATVELVYDTVRMSMTGEGMDVDFDSTKPAKADDPIAGALKEMVGATLVLDVDEAGNITRVSGGQKLGAMGAMLTAGQKPKEAFGNLLSLQHGSGLVAVGESWTNEDVFEQSMIGRFRMVTKHTLRSARGGLANVLVTGRIEPVSQSDTQLLPIQISDSKYEGSYVWDTRRGQLQSMTTEQSSTIEAEVAGSKLVQKSRSIVKVKRVR